MNCKCNPPVPATVKKVLKGTQNVGRDFFCCANSSCNLFHWVGSSIPASLHQNSLSYQNNEMLSLSILTLK